MAVPFYLDNVDALREKLARAERDGTRMGQVWSAMRRRAQAAPGAFPWFTPFVGMVTQAPDDLEAARNAIRGYTDTFAVAPFGMGLQFHFWCYAFPHARWALYFSWLHSIGAWDPEEGARLAEEFVRYQFVHFFYGMRTKPEPECVDNQTMSLCYANALIGHLFSPPPFNSALAARMRIDGERRLPSMLGGMPPSGYSGEGSTYMDCVVGPSIPLIVEYLERAVGGEWYTRSLPPNGGSAAAITRMIAREWMPNGLLLPWDHYGYMLPTRSCIAHGAYRTSEPIYHALLEEHANWNVEASIGWGYDDLVWALLWWPEARPATTGPVFPSWAAPEVGGALVSDDARLYLMQMWDHTEPGMPLRAHMNPNALVLSAYGSPLTIDGVPAQGCEALNFDGAWLDRTGMDFNARRISFGSGCAGGHGVLLVDGAESQRALRAYHQADLVEADAVSITGDVTPLYREHWPDTRVVRRRSRLVANRGWLIDDLAVFGAPHAVTARWYLRPERVDAARGIAIETAEGVRLTLLPLLGSDGPVVRRIDGFPDRLDGASLQVDFTQHGTEVRWLWLAWPEETRGVHAEIADGWRAATGAAGPLDTGRALLDASSLTLPFTQPAFMLADLPVARGWWYRRTVEAPPGRWWLRLPTLLMAPRLWVNGAEIDLAPYAELNALLPVQVPIEASGTVEIVVYTECGVSQYGEGDRGGTGFSGQPAVLTPAPSGALIDAAYADGTVTITSADGTWTIPHTLLTGEEA
jgi:hypothetical protein